ncbi:hypothetical protein B0H19DRAFT_1277393 [Mycena capillaripes]|nr:hypothetical protein B0H19DRAFT_1277393 [Mycena capillaripes]
MRSFDTSIPSLTVIPSAASTHYPHVLSRHVNNLQYTPQSLSPPPRRRARALAIRPHECEHALVYCHQSHQPVFKPKARHVGAAAPALAREPRALSVCAPCAGCTRVWLRGSSALAPVSVPPACASLTTPGSTLGAGVGVGGGKDALGAGTDGRAAADPIALTLALDSVGMAPGPRLVRPLRWRGSRSCLPPRLSLGYDRCEYLLRVPSPTLPLPTGTYGACGVLGTPSLGEPTLPDAREAEERSRAMESVEWVLVPLCPLMLVYPSTRKGDGLAPSLLSCSLCISPNTDVRLANDLSSGPPSRNVIEATVPRTMRMERRTARQIQRKFETRVFSRYDAVAFLQCLFLTAVKPVSKFLFAIPARVIHFATPSPIISPPYSTLLLFGPRPFANPRPSIIGLHPTPPTETQMHPV